MTRWPPCPAPFNLAAHVLARAARHPDRIALQVIRPAGAERWSFARLEAAVFGCAAGLVARGLVPGDRILMRIGNSTAFPVLFLGAIAAGLVPVPTAAALTVAEITRMARIVAPALIVAEAGLALPDGCTAPVMAAAEIAAMERLAPLAPLMGSPDRPAYVVFTSGTSGTPLAVEHAHRAIWARGMMRQGWEGLQEGDRLLHGGALNWTFTLGTGLLDPWVAGATALVPGPGVEPGQLGLLARRFDATILAGVPGLFRRMLAAGLPPLPRLRHGLAAGEPLPARLRDDWQAATGTDLHEALGMSECSTFISGAPSAPAPPGFAGRAQPGRRVAVLTEAGPMDTGEGELAVHRSDPGLMLGYLGDPARTASRFQGDWFCTGDRVVIAPDGWLRYQGRTDDMLNPGGFRLSPLEVEAALADAPGVGELAVTEVEVKPGTRLLACLYTAKEDPGAEALSAHAAARLAPFKCPRLWLRVDALPRSANHKLNRRELRALAATLPRKETP